MAKRKYEFKPDPNGGGLWNKLHLTPTQRRAAWRWLFYTLLFLACLVVQDAFLGRFRFFGACIDLVPCVIMLVYLHTGAQAGCVFALCASAFYAFSGSAPGLYVTILITVIGAVVSCAQHSFLQPGFYSDWLCTAVSMVAYELCVFGMGLILSQTHPGRAGVFLLAAVLCALVTPVLYLPVERIGKMGGQLWNE